MGLENSLDVIDVVLRKSVGQTPAFREGLNPLAHVSKTIWCFDGWRENCPGDDEDSLLRILFMGSTLSDNIGTAAKLLANIQQLIQTHCVSLGVSFIDRRGISGL